MPIKIKAGLNSFRAKDFLKDQGFSYSPLFNGWVRDFDGAQAFVDWRDMIFLNQKVVGKRQLTTNKLVHFERVK